MSILPDVCASHTYTGILFWTGLLSDEERLHLSEDFSHENMMMPWQSICWRGRRNTVRRPYLLIFYWLFVSLKSLAVCWYLCCIRCSALCFLLTILFLLFFAFVFHPLRPFYHDSLIEHENVFLSQNIEGERDAEYTFPNVWFNGPGHVSNDHDWVVVSVQVFNHLFVIIHP